MSDHILVLGATGTVGKAVIDRLKEENVQVSAGVRNLDKADFGAGVEKRWLDYSQPDSYGPAFGGINRVFMITPPFFEEAPEAFGRLIEAAGQAGVQHIVLSTAMGTQYNPESEHFAIERALMESGIAYTLLRPNFYSQNYLTYDREATLNGVIFLPASDAKASYVDVKDIAEATWAAFQSPDAIGQAYDLTGPEALDQTEIAAILSEVTGRPTRYLNPTEAEYEAQLRQYQLPEPAIQQLKAVYFILRVGMAAPVSPDFTRLTGKPATSFRAFVQDQLVPEQA